MTDRLNHLATALRCGLFASRPTVDEATRYAAMVLRGLDDADRIAATIAQHVLLNAVADEIDRANQGDRASQDMMLDALQRLLHPQADEDDADHARAVVARFTRGA